MVLSSSWSGHRNLTPETCVQITLRLPFQWLRGVEVSTSLFQGLDSGALPDGAAMWDCDKGHSGGFLIPCQLDTAGSSPASHTTLHVGMELV